MELPLKLTTDLRLIQNQLKLAIQTHQTLRIRNTNDPNLHKDLREVEKRITSLGEKQNQLMRLLRKIITSNSALMANTIATSLGFAINGSHEYAVSTLCKASSNHVLSPKTCNTAVLTSVKEQTQNKPSKLTVQKKTLKGNIGIKERLEGVKTFGEEKNETGRVRMRVGRPSKRSLVVSSEDMKKQQFPDSSERLSEPLTAEKEKFLSAVGLVTREILKELQNRRVERKRRSTANHNQFVYGSSWDISSKKRKKNNYLSSSSSSSSSSSKQPVTRQVNKTQNPKIDVSKTPPTLLKVDSPLVIFKPPLPVTVQNPPLIVEPRNSCNALHQAVTKNQAVMKTQLVLKSQSVLKCSSATKSQSILKTETVTKSQSLLKSQHVKSIMKSQHPSKSAPTEKNSIAKSQSLSKSPTIMRSPTFPKCQTLIKNHTVVNSHTIIKNYTAIRSQTVVSDTDKYTERLSPFIPSPKKGNECRIMETCIVCHKLAAGAIACSCNMRYHRTCAERIENCLGCGYKIKSNFRDASRAKERTVVNGRHVKKENSAHT